MRCEGDASPATLCLPGLSEKAVWPGDGLHRIDRLALASRAQAQESERARSALSDRRARAAGEVHKQRVAAAEVERVGPGSSLRPKGAVRSSSRWPRIRRLARFPPRFCSAIWKQALEPTRRGGPRPAGGTRPRPDSRGFVLACRRGRGTRQVERHPAARPDGCVIHGRERTSLDRRILLLSCRTRTAPSRPEAGNQRKRGQDGALPQASTTLPSDARGPSGSGSGGY
jgi:hypothetical protein